MNVSESRNVISKCDYFSMKKKLELMEECRECNTYKP